MFPDDKNAIAWVTTAVRELRAAGSWTGRIHIHKLLSTVELLKLANPPFEFALYHYGPYSHDLDSTIALMDAHGLLMHEYPEPGYGPKYGATDLAAGLPPDSTEAEVLRKVAAAFGDRNSKELELLVTCMWVEKREGVKDDTELLARVRELKPKYKPDEINDHIAKARELEKSLTAA